MNTTSTLKLLAALALGTIPLQAAITIPGADGSDGVLNITANTEIDLSQAPTGTWNANNSANAGKGIYDASKWAVVFKYSSVTVAPGAALTFKNHASRAPVVWLVSGNVTINGAVSLDGQPSQSPPFLAEPGPGGYRGGSAYFSAGVGASPGFGMGGGKITYQVAGGTGYGEGASYGTRYSTYAPTYGNPSLIPLIGGSGGAGANTNNYYVGGSAGGGAILIACSNSVALAGEVRSNGGWVQGQYGESTGSGSGGGVRVVADTFSGAGFIRAISGATQNGYNAGGLGRIRIERVANTSTATVTPDPSVVDLAAATTALLWPPTGAPEVKIISIGGVNAPADPRAAFGTIGADVALPTTNTTTVIVETTNVEQASQVKVRMTPRSNANYTEVAANYVNEPSPGVRRWSATFNATVNVGYSAVQVRVIRP